MVKIYDAQIFTIFDKFQAILEKLDETHTLLYTTNMSFHFFPRRTLQTRMATYFSVPKTETSQISFRELQRYVSTLRPSPGESLQTSASKRLQFGKIFLPDYTPFPYSSFHSFVLQTLRVRSRLGIIILPRDAGKGTMLFIDDMYDLAYELEPYIVRIEHDGKTAKNESFKIAHEWTHNHLLLRNFPHVTPGDTWKPGGGELRFKNGNKFQSMGLKELLRGLTELNSRISKARVNDPVKNAQEARSHVHSSDVYDFVMRSVAKSGGSLQESPLSYSLIGTCQAKGDAIDRLMQVANSKILKVPALLGPGDALLHQHAFDQELVHDLLDCLSSHAKEIGKYSNEMERDHASVTFDDRQKYFEQYHQDFTPFFALQSFWDARFPLVDLFFDAAGDTGGFAQEMLHLTEDVKYIKFQDAWFLPYNGQIPDGSVTYAITIDPSGEPKEGTDPMAIYAGGFHHGLQEIFTQHVWCDQGTPNDLVRKTYEIFWQYYPWYTRDSENVRVYMEDSIGSSGSGYTLFETTRLLKIAEGGDPSYWIELPLRLLDPKKLGNKLAGISALRLHFEQGRMHYIPRHSHQELMKTQFLNYNGKHTHQFLPPEFKIDICDTVRMFWHIASKGRAMRPFAMYGNE
jgi:hypothetical protein